MKKPMDVIMDGVEWKETGQTTSQDNMPFATHECVLYLSGLSIKCYRLNDGRAILDAEDMDKFWKAMTLESTQTWQYPYPQQPGDRLMKECNHNFDKGVFRTNAIYRVCSKCSIGIIDPIYTMVKRSVDEGLQLIKTESEVQNFRVLAAKSQDNR